MDKWKKRGMNEAYKKTMFSVFLGENLICLQSIKWKPNENSEGLPQGWQDGSLRWSVGLACVRADSQVHLSYSQPTTDAIFDATYPVATIQPLMEFHYK